MRFAIQQLRNNPGFTVVALLTLALGIGANTTAFTVLNRLLLQTLPFRDPQTLVHIWSTSAQGQRNWQAPGDYFDEHDQNSVFDNVAAYFVDWEASIAELGKPASRCVAMKVVADYFPLMGIHPVLGREFTTDDETHHDTPAILSHKYWVDHFAADPSALGHTLLVNGKVYTIVGVMAPQFDNPTLFGDHLDFWILDDAYVNRNLRNNGWYSVVARLKPGVTIDQANVEMSILAKRMAHDNPKTNEGRGLNVVPYPTNSVGETGARMTWLVMGLSGIVLLIACVNLANLQLVRTTGRSKEFAIRLALGCPRFDLIRMMLAESILISVVGGALGLLVAKWSNSYLAKYLQVDMPLNLQVLGFTFLVAVVTGAVVGIIPAWIASRSDVNSAIKQGSRGSTSDRSRHRLRQSLIVLELAMALTLLAGAAYFVRGIQVIAGRELGWNPEGVLVGYIGLDHDHYGEQGDPRALAFGDRILKELGSLPGVESIGLSNSTPVWGMSRTSFVLKGQPVVAGKEPWAYAEYPSPGFFRTYGMRLLQGRDFIDTDRPGKPGVVIISQEMAEKFWPGESAVGKQIGTGDLTNPDWLEIVGVVNNITAAGDLSPPHARYAVYRPWAQNPFRFMAITLRCSTKPEGFKETLRKVVGKLEPNIAFTELATANEMIAEDMNTFMVVRRMLIQVAVLGLFLAAIGIYGVIANLASERTKEVGIRMALGARSNDVVWLFLRDGILLAIIGTVSGLVGAIALVKVLESQIAKVPGYDPLIVVGMAVLLFAVSIIACWLPARRATRVNPTIALRAE